MQVVTVPRFFLVEHRLPRITDAELALLQATLNDTCLRLTTRGQAVRYLGSAYLPGPSVATRWPQSSIQL